mgnify:CR=1 FL=1
MGKNAAAADFTTQLHAERDALEAFITLLGTEQQALLGGDTEQLLTLAESKIQAANSLSKLAGSRERNQLALGATSANGGMTTWLKTHAANNLPLWQDIQRLAEQAQQLNRTNGIMIQAKLRHNQQALSVLNNATNRASGLYGPDGQPNISTSGRTLGSV